MAALIVASVLAAILGFAAHRASVCTVRAVAEIASSRTAYMLASIGKSVLWVMAVTVPVLLLMPWAADRLTGWPLTVMAVAGGFLFGVGAAINGACAYSTMARLMDGEGGMAVTVIAFAVGAVLFATLVDLRWLARPQPATALFGSLAAPLMAAASVLAAWCLYECARLWRSRPQGARLRDLAFAPSYRLSSAAMVIGLSSAIIFLIYGTASYTVTVQQLVEAWRGSRGFPPAERWVLLLAVLFGMLLSTLQRGSFRFDWRPRRAWMRNIVGGLLMAVGVGLAPGGNDTLVLYGVPSLSPHALPALLSMGLGIAIGLLAMRAWFGIEVCVACRNDVYVSTTGTDR